MKNIFAFETSSSALAIVTELVEPLPNIMPPTSIFAVPSVVIFELLNCSQLLEFTFIVPPFFIKRLLLSQNWIDEEELPVDES